MLSHFTRTASAAILSLLLTTITVTAAIGPVNATAGTSTAYAEAATDTVARG